MNRIKLCVGWKIVTSSLLSESGFSEFQDLQNEDKKTIKLKRMNRIKLCVGWKIVTSSLPFTDK